ncbi:hypothetical protein IFM89_024351 [Coptis chinensis]|uniref:Uncharacterized protein n=1 Tax=Coptis chinensis TaxID=261450 RepID=A0A835IY65_9MAGN|nr:hypothetical protein IFM89_024351 [Coptis chinensis]
MKKMEEKQSQVERRKGGMRTMPFIFANEVTEKLAVVGFGANMISYLTLQLHLPLTKAANTLTNFGGTASLTPLLGAFIADSFAGRFWTITVASIIYQIVKRIPSHSKYPMPGRTTSDLLSPSSITFLSELAYFPDFPAYPAPASCPYWLRSAEEESASTVKGFEAFFESRFSPPFTTASPLAIGFASTSVLGMISLTTSAVLPSLRPPPCKDNQVCIVASSGQLAILYVSLALTAIGSGGIRPCVVSFGADQFDQSDPTQKTRTWNFFNWYYFGMGFSILIAVTVIVYIQDHIGWGWGLGIPSMAMGISIIAFLIGYPLYRHIDPSGSPFTRLIQVIVAAIKKRKVPMVSDPNLLYENEELDAAISTDGKLLHTNQLSRSGKFVQDIGTTIVPFTLHKSKVYGFLDRAAIVTEEDNLKSSPSPNLWRLCTVHRVEELKSIIRMGPIWASGILLITAYAQQGTFSLQQARTMNRHLKGSFQIPPGSMSVFTIVPMLTTITLYDRVLIRIARRFTGLDRGITFLQRMGIGLAISILATLVAGFIEIKRKNVAIAHGLIDHPHATIPISVFWLVPQYGLHGIAEAFMSIGHLEFLYDQAPESMRSTAAALFWTAISIGNYVSTFLVTLVHKYSAKPDGSNWLPDTNLNKGKLENLYWLITVLQILNFVYYLICAMFYTFKPIQFRQKEDDKEGVELAERV